MQKYLLNCAFIYVEIKWTAVIILTKFEFYYIKKVNMHNYYYGTSQKCQTLSQNMIFKVDYAVILFFIYLNT